MKHFNWGQTAAAAISKILSNLRERMTGGPSAALPPAETEAQHTAVDAWCLDDDGFVATAPRAFNVRNIRSVLRFVATRWPEHLWHPVGSSGASTRRRLTVEL